MPILANAKHEIFCQALAKGTTATDAYILAGYKANDGNAATLKGNQRILDRVAEIQAAGAAKSEISIERVLRELGRLGFSDLRKAFRENGSLKRPEEWDDDTAAAIASVEVVTRRVPGGDDDEVEHVHKIKVWDKNSALEKLAKHLGMFVERHEHSVSDTLADLMREIDGRTRGLPNSG